MATITTTPELMIPGKQATIIVNRTQAGSDWLKVWCTLAPNGTEYAKAMVDRHASQVDVYEGPGGLQNSWQWTPEMSGHYQFAVQEYKRYPTADFQGGYAGDPHQTPAPTQVGPKQIIDLHIGQRMKVQVGVGLDVATLVVWARNDQLLPTTMSAHGEATPALIDPWGRARQAVVSPAVKDALRALPGNVSDVVGDLAAMLSGLVSSINQHIASTTFHNIADTANVIPPEFGSEPNSDYRDTVNEILMRLRRHMLNDCGGTSTTLPGTGTAQYHKVPTAQYPAGEPRADKTNLPLMRNAATTAEAYAAIADLWRAFEGHRINTTVHKVSDTTNALAPLPAMANVHRRIFEALAGRATDGTTPEQAATEQAMTTALLKWGYELT